MGTFLSAHIQDAAVSHVQNSLQGERTLTDSRFTAQERNAARDHSATQHTVQLLVPHIDARFINRRNIAKFHRRSVMLAVLPAKHRGNSTMTHGHSGILRSLRSGISSNTNFLKCIPLSAARTFAHPFGTFLSAIAAHKSNLIFRHFISFICNNVLTAHKGTIYYRKIQKKSNLLRIYFISLHFV